MASNANRREVKGKKRINLYEDQIERAGANKLKEAINAWSTIVGPVKYNTFQSAYYSLRRDFPDPEMGDECSRRALERRCSEFYRWCVCR